MKFYKTPNLFRWFSKKLIWSFSIQEDIVYLTFDDGPNVGITEYYLDRLKELNWKATFFCVGQNIDRNPELFKRIIAEGHAIGNHTSSHLNGFKMNKNKYVADVNELSARINTNLFRPPYGKITKSQITELSKNHHIIMWSFMTYDFDVKSSKEILCQRLNLIKKGDIIVSHDNEKFIDNEKEVFELLVVKLLEKGLKSDKIQL